MNKNISNVITSLLDALTSAGFCLKEYECDGYTKIPVHQHTVVANIHESMVTDLGLRHHKEPKTVYWVRIVTDNEPSAIVNDYSAEPRLEAVIDPWSDSWDDCEWIPRKQ